MDETLQYIYQEVVQNYIPDYIKAIEFEYTPWVFSLLGAALIGLSGILPLLVIPADTGSKDSQFSDRKLFNIIYHKFHDLCIFILKHILHVVLCTM